MQIITSVFFLDDYGAEGWMQLECSVCGPLCLCQNENIARGVSEVHLMGVHGYLSRV